MQIYLRDFHFAESIGVTRVFIDLENAVNQIDGLMVIFFMRIVSLTRKNSFMRI